MASIFTPVAKVAGFVAKEAIRTTAYTGAATLLAGGAAAVTVAGAAAYVGMRSWDALGKRGFGMNRHRVDVPFTRGRMGFNVPTNFNARTQMLIGGAPFAMGATAGAVNSMRTNWDINQAVSTGAVEVERPQFMGATGSLTLSMYRHRNRRARMQQEIDQRTGRFSGLNLTPSEQRHLNAALMEFVV